MWTLIRGLVVIPPRARSLTDAKAVGDSPARALALIALDIRSRCAVIVAADAYRRAAGQNMVVSAAGRRAWTTSPPSRVDDLTVDSSSVMGGLLVTRPQLR